MRDYTNFGNHALKVNTDDYNVLVSVNAGAVRISLKTVTWDGEIYKGLINNISPLSFNLDADLQNTINRQSISISFLADNVADAGEKYQDLLTGALLNEDVAIRIILGSAQDDFVLQTWYLYDYELKYGILTLKLKTQDQKVYNEQFISSDEIYNFGDFGNNFAAGKSFVWQDQGWFYHSNRLARGIKTGDRQYTFCSKEMHDVPSGTVEFAKAFYAYIRSELYNRGFWVRLILVTSNILTNGSDGCNIEIAEKTDWEEWPDDTGQRICTFPQPYDGAEPTYDAGSNDLVDGNQNTSVALDIIGTGEHTYAFTSDDIAAIKDAMKKNIIFFDGWNMSFDFGVIASGEQINIVMRRKSDDASIDSTFYIDTSSDGQATYDWNTGATFENIDTLDDYYWVFFATGAGVTLPIIKNFVIGLTFKFQDAPNYGSGYHLKVSEIENLYMRSEGVEYDDDWDSRVTPGDLIERPVRILEYIARLQIAEAQIDMDQFDDINTVAAFDTTLTLVSNHSLNRIIQIFTKTFGINLVHRILTIDTFYPILYSDGINYANSGTGTPDDEDKFTDIVAVSAGEFDKNPIQQKTLSIKLKPGYQEITFNYSKIIDSLYLDSSNSGSGIEKIVNTDFFSSEEEFDNADSSLDLIDRYIVEKRIILFKTFINAFIYEVGDALAFDHALFLDHFELSRIKGIVYTWSFDFMKKIIIMKLTEVDNTV